MQSLLAVHNMSPDVTPLPPVTECILRRSLLLAEDNLDTQSLLDSLQSFRDRLTGDVVDAYKTRGRAFGNERFAAWRQRIRKFLDDNLPGESSKLDAKLTHFVLSVRQGESDFERFWREDGEAAISFIDSLAIDVRNGEYETPPLKVSRPLTQVNAADSTRATSTRVFIVHGHDALAKTETARFVEKLGFEAIILHEQASGGKTIIEKIEAYTDVSFAIVLYTPDDKGNAAKAAESGTLLPRARQNVVFEHGYLMAKLGRERVVPLVGTGIELPSDISGIVYVSNSNWRMEIAKEMQQAGYLIDFAKLV